jgi:two-component system, chemotaxis family, sensor kinase CheA
MNPDTSHVLPQIKAAISETTHFDKSDLTKLTGILSMLEEFSAGTTFSEKCTHLARRGAGIALNMIMEETPFETGRRKLRTCLEKIAETIDNGHGCETYDEHDGDTHEKNVSTKQVDTIEDSTITIGETSTSVNSSVYGYTNICDDNMDLVVKFASQKIPMLDDFEVFVLEMEKGHPQAIPSIKRLLHTIKGEFGVLGLQQYAHLIHLVEEAVEKRSISADNLFRLKDLLGYKFGMFCKNTIPDLTQDELHGIFGKTTQFEMQQTTSETNCQQCPQTRFGPEYRNPACTVEVDADTELLADFITESHDHIHTAETMLLSLECDPENFENINEVFRACHTIKGVAAFLGLAEISGFAHAIENCMDLARKGSIVLDATRLDVLLESLDCLRAMMKSVESVVHGGVYSTPPHYEHLMSRLSAPFQMETSFPGSAGPTKRVGEILVGDGAIDRNQLDEALSQQKDGDGRKIGEILLEKKAATAREVGRALAGQNKQQKGAGVQETIRVPVDRLDHLINAIGEAVIAHSMIAADPGVVRVMNSELEKKVTQSTVSMRQIQELSMSLRMVSMKSTFQKMARLVRDLAKKSGKEVEFHTEGEDTELDKSVVENIGDPLIHMIRNAIDHGIEESVEERRAAGKPANASVHLRAFHKAGNIYIEIADDGKGLERDAILEKAIQQGLCKKDERLLDQEIYPFIFHPGFSTAKKITDISGRGVGMDVVRRNIQTLRGSIEIQSEKGKGTRFSIRLPLTLAIIDGMVVRVNGERYILPTLSIIEMLMPKAEQVQHVFGNGEALNVRGRLYPLVRLCSIFGANDVTNDIFEGIVIIVEDMIGKHVAIHVDEIIGQQQVVIKSIGTGIGTTPGVAGGAIMSDGTVSLIVDIGDLVRMVNE